MGLATHQAVLARGLHELSHLVLALLPSTLRFLCGEVGTDRDPAPTVCDGPYLQRAVLRPQEVTRMDVLLCENILMKAFEGRSFLCSQLKVQSVMVGIGMAGSRSSSWPTPDLPGG